MRAIILALLLTGCYTDEDAKKSFREMGRPEPISCNYMDSRAESYACHDAAGLNWICSERFGCTQWGSK